MALKFGNWSPAGNSYASRAIEALFSIGWQSPRDRVSKKILVVVQSYHTLAENENDSKNKNHTASFVTQISRDTSTIKEPGMGSKSGLLVQPLQTLI